MIPTRIGQECHGGTFAGFNRIGNTVYSLIVAPKHTETIASLKTSYPATLNTTSVIDGKTNSQAMNGPEHPAVHYISSLNTNGYNDWYLPSHNELELAYRNLKPSSTISRSSFTSIQSAIFEENGRNTTSIPTGAQYNAHNPVQTIVHHCLENNKESFGLSYYFRTSTLAPRSSTWSLVRCFANGDIEPRQNTSKSAIRPFRREPVVTRM